MIMVHDEDEDFEVEAIFNPIGYIRLHCHNSSGQSTRIPKLTSEEARLIAAELIAAAEASGGGEQAVTRHSRVTESAQKSETPK